MSSISGRLLTMLLLAATTLAAQQATRRVLQDYRIDGRQGPVKDGSKLALRDEQQVLSALFPRYLTSEDACNRENQYKVDAETERRNGEIVPSIEEFVGGSFTAPGRQQAAYFVKVGECFDHNSRGSYFGSFRLAIFEGPTLVTSVAPTFVWGGMETKANALVTVADVNNDGIDDLLLQSGGYGQGEVEVSAGLVSLRDGKLQSVREFDDVYDNRCGNGEAGSRRVTASRITYAPSGVLVERYEAPCAASRSGNVPALKDFRRVPQSVKQ